MARWLIVDAATFDVLRGADVLDVLAESPDPIFGVELEGERYGVRLQPGLTAASPSAEEMSEIARVEWLAL